MVGAIFLVLVVALTFVVLIVALGIAAAAWRRRSGRPPDREP